MVLRSPDKARDAYARSLQLRPNDPALKQALADAVAQVGGQPASPAR